MRVRHPAEREAQFRDALRKDIPFLALWHRMASGRASLSLSGEERP